MHDLGVHTSIYISYRIKILRSWSQHIPKGGSSRIGETKQSRGHWESVQGVLEWLCYKIQDLPLVNVYIYMYKVGPPR